MKKFGIHLGIFSLLLIALFSSCAADYVEEEAFVYVDDTYSTTHTEYDFYGNQFNYNEINLTLHNSGNYTAYDVSAEITVYTYAGAVIKRSILLNYLVDGGFYTTYEPVDLVNDQIKDYKIDLFWND